MALKGKHNNMQSNSTVGTQAEQVDVNAMLAQLQAIMGSKKAAVCGTLTVGVSWGLLTYLLSNRKDNQVATTFRAAFVGGDGYSFKTAQEELSIAASRQFIGEVDKMIQLAGSVMEVRVSMSYEEISELVDEMYEGHDGVPMTYCHLTVELLGSIEGRVRIAKNEEGVEEEVYFLRAGTVRKASKPSAANNPFSDDSSLADPEKLKQGLLAAAGKSRQGFNNWRDAQPKAVEGTTATSTGPSLTSLMSREINA